MIGSRPLLQQPANQLHDHDELASPNTRPLSNTRFPRQCHPSMVFTHFVSGIQHLSMRVPWRDRPWDQFICHDPLGNSSCALLSNIGRRRDDSYEVDHHSEAIDTLDQDRLPCLSERATFMSSIGYTVTKKHPYAKNAALKAHLHPSAVHVPPYAFEAIPFRWLNRRSVVDDVGLDRIPTYNPSAEDDVDQVLHYDGASWVMDGDNQRACIDAFFDPVASGHSLVFMYLKHSPLQEERTDRLLAGVARVARVTLPPMWNQTGKPPFTSSMWETIVEHTLRSDMTDGVLLPYQDLVPLLDQGADVSGALAWAPEGREVEFSYVTEHLSDDAALEALAAIDRACRGMRDLGLTVPDSALTWLETQSEQLWQIRGPVPGFASVLEVLGVDKPRVAARTILDHITGNDGAAAGDPWPTIEACFVDPAAAGDPLRSLLSSNTARLWRKLPSTARDVLKLLSTFDISAEQVRMLTERETEIEIEDLSELLANPYYAVTCTYGQLDHVPFTTVDRALYPPAHVTWRAPIPIQVALDGPRDRRRIEALLTDVLERQGADGDTLLPLGETIEAANAIELSHPPNINHIILQGADLDYDALLAAGEAGQWSPLLPVELADGTSAYKLARFEETSNVIRDAVDEQLGYARLGALANARAALDAALKGNQAVDAREDDPLEEPGRQEKAAGLSVLHDSALTVLIGPAGTGKTTLLRALVDLPGVADGGVLLLAPTGKARVQLETKVNRPAQTLASYLATSDRYDFDTGRYLVWGPSKPRRSYSLIVIDESSMLTEEMLAATLDAFTGVKRLVLVGDPRQLPPIGAGRPFVDLVAKLRPDTFDDWIRVGENYVELQVTRRQPPSGGHGTRHDLALAAWFGDDSRSAADDDVWTSLAADPNRATVRYEPWGDRTVLQTINDVLLDELGIAPDAAEKDRALSFALSYGATVHEKYTNWELGAGTKAEAWQILSPTRSRMFGTVELNRHIKRAYRADDTRFAQRTFKANIAAPYGPELIVRGDKVMQTRNDRRSKAKTKLNYIANGEIGVVIGRIVPTSKQSKQSLWLDVEFSSQNGFTYGYRPTSGDNNIDLELAWAVTVHKSQGSEFDMTFLVLPARANPSRELLYTALTRQRHRVVIVHEGTLDELRELAEPWRSETARRLTDLFAAPTPVTLVVRGAAARFDRNLMHVSADGTPMRSKNEVIIAGLLDRLAPGRWTYEEPLTGGDGRTVSPDFTIMTSDGRKVVWEHAGMLELPDYARKWELKKDWYADNGFLPHSAGGGPNGTLFWTESSIGADAQLWLAQAAEVLGADPGAVAGPAAGPAQRRIAKKAPRRAR